MEQADGITEDDEEDFLFVASVSRGALFAKEDRLGHFEVIGAKFFPEKVVGRKCSFIEGVFAERGVDFFDDPVKARASICLRG